MPEMTRAPVAKLETDPSLLGSVPIFSDRCTIFGEKKKSQSLEKKY